MQDAQEQTERLAGMLLDSRKRTLELASDLSDEQMIGPQLCVVNPPLWEIGHLAWFQERWNLRRVTDEDFSPSGILKRGDELYDSMEVAHDARWNLPLLSREETLSYVQRVLDETLRRLRTEGLTPEVDYFARLAAFHEDMHGEAFTYTRQTHGLPAPLISDHEPGLREDQPRGPLEGDAEVPGGKFMLGATEDMGFVFDNEKWAHPVRVAPFKISRAPVTNEQFGAFVDDGVYRRLNLWGEGGRRWLDQTGVEHPVYWSRVGDGWHRRRFDTTEPLNPPRAGRPRELARGRGLLPVGRPPPPHRGRVGDGRFRRARRHGQDRAQAPLPMGRGAAGAALRQPGRTPAGPGGRRRLPRGRQRVRLPADDGQRLGVVRRRLQALPRLCA
jgi:iron(II)-dependent oxidoreductase